MEWPEEAEHRNDAAEIAREVSLIGKDMSSGGLTREAPIVAIQSDSDPSTGDYCRAPQISEELKPETEAAANGSNNGCHDPATAVENADKQPRGGEPGRQPRTSRLAKGNHRGKTRLNG